MHTTTKPAASSGRTLSSRSSSSRSARAEAAAADEASAMARVRTAKPETRPASPRPDRSRIRVVGADDTVASVDLEVCRISAMTHQVTFAGAAIGYITRTEHSFVASVGPSPGAARSLGRFDLWDQAAAVLLFTTVSAHPL